MSYYPYGSVPGQGYVQPGVQANPVGYAAPVANPFHQLMVNHGVSKMISGMTGSSSYSGDSDVSVVTYDSYMKDKDYSKTTLGITESDLKTFGKPLGLKFKDCGVLIPLPAKRSVCNAIDNKIGEVTKGLNRTLSDKQKKELIQKINDGLAKEFFTNQCTYGSELDPQGCAGFGAELDSSGIPTGGINTVEDSIRTFLN